MNRRLLTSGILLVSANHALAQNAPTAGVKYSPGLWPVLLGILILLLVLTFWLTRSIDKRRENN